MHDQHERREQTRSRTGIDGLCARSNGLWQKVNQNLMGSRVQGPPWRLEANGTKLCYCCRPAVQILLPRPWGSRPVEMRVNRRPSSSLSLPATGTSSISQSSVITHHQPATAHMSGLCQTSLLQTITQMYLPHSCTLASSRHPRSYTCSQSLMHTRVTWLVLQSSTNHPSHVLRYTGTYTSLHRNGLRRTHAYR